MLFRQSVKPEVFFLLERLMSEPLLGYFRLVGGTALALQKGHRHSDDIDLFTDSDFDLLPVENLLKEKYNDGTDLKISTFVYGLTAYYYYGASEVLKIDLMNFHSDPFLFDPVEIDGIRFARLEDIAAMKLQAITTRKSRKDFIDIYVLMKEFSLREMLGFFERRFVYYDKKDVLIALANANQADRDFAPKMLEDISWEAVKKKLTTELAGYIKDVLKYP